MPEFSFAFQPIVDTVAGTIFSYEALIRGRNGEPAHHVLGNLQDRDLYLLDQRARVVAIELAARLGIGCHLNLNCLPRGLYKSTTALQSTVESSELAGIPLERLVIEVTEAEVVDDQARFAEALNEYRSRGMKIAIDDFGAGYSGLNLLADFQPDMVKLDIALVRDIESKGPRQAIVRAILQVCVDLGIDVLAEGVETAAERAWFEAEGVNLFQGYLFAKPAFERLEPPETLQCPLLPRISGLRFA